jgi:hypothetical protein
MNARRFRVRFVVAILALVAAALLIVFFVRPATRTVSSRSAVDHADAIADHPTLFQLMYPEPQTSLAKVTVTSGPELSKLKVWLEPPLTRWGSPEALRIKLHLLNDGDDPITVAWLPSSILDCVRELAQPAKMPIGAHNSASADFAMDASNCSAGQRSAGIPFQTRFTAEEKVVAKKDSGSPGSGPKVQISFEGLIATSPIVFQTASEVASARRLRVFHGLYTLVKELIWPVALAVLGFFLSSIATHRSNEETERVRVRESEESARTKQQEAEATERIRTQEAERTERARQDGIEQTTRVMQQELEQTRRAERQEILTHLLPEYIKRVQEHYLPIARRIQTVEDEWEGLEAAWKKSPPKQGEALAQLPDKPEEDSLTRTLSAILLMRRRVQFLLIKEGGVFFRTSIGEEIFDLCISEFFDQCRKHLGKDAFESASTALDPATTLPLTIRQVFGPVVAEANPDKPAAAPLWGLEELTKFYSWVADAADGQYTFDRYVNLLKLSRQLLGFECDRTFYQTDPDPQKGASGWYFDPPSLDIRDDMCRIPAVMDAAADRDAESEDYSRSRIFKLLELYLKGIPEECRPKKFQLPKDWLAEEQKKATANLSCADTKIKPGAGIVPVS